MPAVSRTSDGLANRWVADVLGLLVCIGADGCFSRPGAKEIQEPTEELRLALVELLGLIVAQYPAHIGLYVDDLGARLQRTLGDPFPQVLAQELIFPLLRVADHLVASRSSWPQASASWRWRRRLPSASA